ncbi:MAG: AtpZ/AtpI family protein [Lachnospiraceae bacterium]|nr:AtpZ/AtpI family protein [Lachnospiraceae bacterium]
MKYGKNVRQSLVLITQFGIDMLVPIFLCSLAGYWLDRKAGTSWIFIVLFFVGAIAGARNVYRTARRITESGSGDVRNRDNAESGLPVTAAENMSGDRETDPYDGWEPTDEREDDQRD